MSLQSFQLALSDLIASPGLCLALRSEPDRVLDRYALSQRERRRLIGVVWQPGMSTSCSLYRSNRLAAIYTLLPLTCLVLGSDLRREAELFWDGYVETDLQFKRECDRFGEFLKMHHPLESDHQSLLWDVLNLELALNDLRFLPRTRILETLRNEKFVPWYGAVRLHPLIRVVQLRHDPIPLLALLTRVQDHLNQPFIGSNEIPEGEFFLLVDAMGEEMQFKRLDPSLARILMRIADSGGQGVSTDDTATLMTANLVIADARVKPATGL